VSAGSSSVYQGHSGSKPKKMGSRAFVSAGRLLGRKTPKMVGYRGAMLPVIGRRSRSRYPLAVRHPPGGGGGRGAGRNLHPNRHCETSPGVILIAKRLRAAVTA